MNNLFVIAMQTQGGGMANIFLLVGVFVVIYFFMIRPQQKRRKEMSTYRKDLQKGDKVVTIGGIYGKVNDIKEDVITLEVAPNSTIRINRNAIVPDTKELQRN